MNTSTLKIAVEVLYTTDKLCALTEHSARLDRGAVRRASITLARASAKLRRPGI